MAFFIIFFFQIHAFSLVHKKIVLNEKRIQIELNSIKTNLKKFISQKQRQKSLDLLNQFQNEYVLSQDQNRNILEMKDVIRTLFFEQETQDLFESSVAQMFQSPRLSEKNIIKCFTSHQRFQDLSNQNL